MTTQELTIERYAQRTLPSIRDLLAIVFRQYRIILLAFTGVVLLAAASGIWHPKYEAQMKILVRRQRSDAIVTSSDNPPSQMFSDQVSEEDLNTEVELLNSEDLLRKVVEATGLATGANASSSSDSELRIASAEARLAKALKIEAVRKTNVISVKYQSRSPQMAEKVLSALASAYLEKHLEVHRSSGEFKFFDQEMRQYQAGMLQAQKALTDFSTKTGVVSAGSERDSALRQASDFDARAQEAHTVLQETEKRVASLRAQLTSMTPRVVTVERNLDNSQLLGQSKSTLLNLELKRTDLLSKYAPDYPLVQEVEEQIAETKASIDAEERQPIHEESSDRDPNYQWVTNELTRAQTELSSLRERERSAASAAALYHKTAEHLDENALTQQDLERAEKTQEDNFILYSHKREEARISEALDRRGIVNVAIADQPEVPVLPTKSLLSLVMLITLCAVAFSVSTGFVVDFLDPSFRTPEELANYLSTPVLASLPSRGE